MPLTEGDGVRTAFAVPRDLDAYLFTEVTELCEVLKAVAKSVSKE